MTDVTETTSKEGEVAVIISEDGLRASIMVTVSVEDKIPTLDMAHAALKEANVTYGIDVDIMQNIFKEYKFGREVTVAFGKPVVDGKDGEVKYFFIKKVDLKPREDEKGNVDYKNIQLIQNVEKGEKLAEVIPPVPGKEGKTVTGTRVLPKPGKVLELPQGFNTEPSPDNPNILIASAAGNVTFKQSSVNVDDVLTIDSNVDYKTGNLDYVGALSIKGNVKAGFEVKSKNDIEISGFVEDAKVIASGSVIIKNGFLGKGDGLIEAEGNVILKFCENQNIKAKGDIIVGEDVLFSNLISGSKIEVQGKRGVIIGGTTRATKGVAVKELGNYQGAKTEVIVGIDDEIVKEIKAIEEEIKKCDENFEKTIQAIYTLSKKVMDKGGASKDLEGRLTNLGNYQEQIPLQKKKLEEKKVMIEEEMRKYADATIEVLSTVYTGTKITIQKYHKIIMEEKQKVRFQLIGEEIKEISL
ncbi:DUF342 domain-containing protein [candidate division KSB1 bacterium]